LACFKFEPPQGCTIADVLRTAHDLRVAAGAYAIDDSHLADAIALLTERRMPSLADA
jgi:glyoxalase family protein